MRHVISKELSREEYVEEFSKIREEFVAALAELDSRTDAKYFACDYFGKPIDWVWNNETFQHDSPIGDLNDAKALVRNLINQGMKVSFMHAREGGEDQIWLFSCEPDQPGPNWPINKQAIFVLTHDGVGRE